MSPRVFDGWAPREVHEHYDADGNLTGTTVVTHEPLWDDTDRARALELAAYETNLCPCGCGQPLEIATDKNRGFVVQTHVCYARKAIAIKKRQDGEEAKRAKKPEGWDDGLTYYIEDSIEGPRAGGVDD